MDFDADNDSSAGLWPRDRGWPFAEVTGLSLLQNAWDHSRRRIDGLQQAIRVEPLPESVACIAVSGSLSRMEAHDRSDLDLLIVVDDREAAADFAHNDALYADIWRRISESPDVADFQLPKPGGVFSQCVSWRTLTDPDVRGIVDEDVTSYGQRMQLLMDSQPVIGRSRFEELLRAVLHWYSEHRVSRQFQETGPFHWLWQDVQRYWRSIRSRACWLHSDQPGESLEVNLKLRSSRVVLVVAFLHSIAMAHARHETHSQMVDHLCRQLRQTPLERLLMPMAADNERIGLLSAYQNLWERIRTLSNSSHELLDEDRSSLDLLRACIRNTTESAYADWLF